MVERIIRDMIDWEQPFPPEEYAARRARLQSALQGAGYDGILVTAAAGHVPPPLVEQLKPGGRMVIPVGGVFGIQHLTLVEKLSDGQIRTRQLLPVRFVPLTRGTQ